MKTAAFLLSALLCLPARAELQQCDDSDFVCNNQRVFVIAQKLKLIEARLRREDKKVWESDGAMFPLEVADRWRDAQKLWVKFAEADRRFESEPAAQSMGSGYGRAYWQCMAERYDQRLKQADDMLDRYHRK